jgi:hypothetical protein
MAARRTRAAGRAPIAVLDIDLTLVENAPRTRRIWRLWLEGLGDRWSGAAAALASVDAMPIVFGVMENLTSLGVEDEALRKEGLEYWLKRFFEDAMCRFDEVLPGAVEAVTSLRAAEVTVAYLTARPAWMREGTVESLARMGFPMCTEGTVLVMKPDMERSDGAFKEGALSWLASLGDVILAADNEPGHCNAMREAFERARVLHVNTRHSSWAPSLIAGVDVVDGLSDGVIVSEGGS